ncbi:MAG: DUF2194 domain-containing protein [Flavobacteriaceae bacterium]
MKSWRIKYKQLFAVTSIILCVNCADNKVYEEGFIKKIDNFTSVKHHNNPYKQQLLNSSKHYLYEAPLIEYVVDYNNQLCIAQSQQLKKICDYTKLPFKTSNIQHWNSPSFTIAPSVKVINIHDPSTLNDQAVQKLLEFVANGGTLLFSSVVIDQRFSYFYGFKIDASHQDDNIASGFNFESPILPNIKGLSVIPSHKHYGYKLENFKKEVTPLITASNDSSYGVVLEHKIGNGRVVFFNTGLMIDKPIRGLVFAMCLPALEGIPYPIANVSTIYLDDFPSPVYNIMKEPIATEMGLTMADFVDKVWWPDMQKLAKEFDINYTTTITFDYNTKVTPPFIFTEWERKNKRRPNIGLSDYFTKSVLKANIELGFHGFNHVSLTTANWKNTDYITTALKTVEKKWQVEGYGKLPISYIPPSNIIDSTGLAKLKQGMPSIKYICSSYFGKKDEGSDREFDIDPYNSTLFDYPRITSEYELSAEKILVKESAYIFTGIWSHFVHPDDVYQIKDKSNEKTSGDYDYRNAHGYGWRISKDGSMGLYPRFKKLLAQHKHTYPLSKYVSAEKGAPMINKWRAADYYHQSSNEYYTVKKKGRSNLKNHYWFVYVSDFNNSELESYLSNNHITYYKTPILEGFLVNIETKYPQLKLPKFNTLVKSDMEVYTNIHHKYNTHFEELLASNEDMSVKEIDVDEEFVFVQSLDKLHEQMFSQKTIDTAAWNNYARMNDWLNKKQDVWEKLDSFYLTNKTLETAKYSDELSKISWYPKEQVKEYWLLEQIRLDPKNTKLLKDYIKYYNSEENLERIELYLKRIAELEGDSVAKNSYLKYILWQNSERTEALLNSISPSNDYSDITDEVAWYYYEKGNIEKAYEWANYTNKIDIAVKLDWLYTLEEYDAIETIFASHIKEHPNDDKAKEAMAYIYHALGNFKESWIVTDDISDDYAGKTKLTRMLNDDVKYVSTDLQNELIESHSRLFKSSVKDSLIQDIRLKNANSIVFNGTIASDRSNNTSFDKISTYVLKNKKKYIHSISFTNSDVYALNTPVIDSANVDKELFGIQYQFNNPESKSLRYWSKVRIEKDRGDAMFYQFGFGANLSKKKSYSSIEYTMFPVKNGVAYNKNIYRNKLGVYHEHNINKRTTVIGYAEGNYYSDDVKKVSLTGRLNYFLIKKPKLSCFPFLEGEYSLGSLNQANGYPYWTLENRLFGGMGVAAQYGNENMSRFMIRADGAHFIDDYAGYFTRLNGKFSVRFLKYYILNTSLEYYIQSKFYSNQFNFGLQYYFK